MIKNLLIIFETITLMVLCYQLHTEKTKVVSEPMDTAKVTTAIDVSTKTNANDPDLKVTTKYVAEVNGRKVEVPVRAKETDTVPLGTTGATNLTAQLRQEVDLTPLVTQAIPKWEVGVGLGKKSGDRNLYIPIAIQRNYKYDKAIQLELHLDTDTHKVNGVEVMHKWRF